MKITKEMLRQGMQGRIRVREIFKSNKLNEDLKKEKIKKGMSSFEMPSLKETKQKFKEKHQPRKIRNYRGFY